MNNSNKSQPSLDMQNNTQPSAAAMRAAEALRSKFEIMDPESVYSGDRNDMLQASYSEITQIIDCETGVKELVEALQQIADGKLYGGAGESVRRLHQCQRIAQQALRNAERKQ